MYYFKYISVYLLMFNCYLYYNYFSYYKELLKGYDESSKLILNLNLAEK